MEEGMKRLLRSYLEEEGHAIVNSFLALSFSCSQAGNANRRASLTPLLETKHGCEKLLNRRRFLRR
jgi:hypothetical protein